MAARDALPLLPVDRRPGDVRQGIHPAEVHAELLGAGRELRVVETLRTGPC
ncbi:MAG: hypothetical protein ACRC4N_18340 [Gammaproteobacteria bacterium]